MEFVRRQDIRLTAIVILLKRVPKAAGIQSLLWVLYRWVTGNLLLLRSTGWQRQRFCNEVSAFIIIKYILYLQCNSAFQENILHIPRRRLQRSNLLVSKFLFQNNFLPLMAAFCFFIYRLLHFSSDRNKLFLKHVPINANNNWCVFTYINLIWSAGSRFFCSLNRLLSGY